MRLRQVNNSIFVLTLTILYQSVFVCLLWLGEVFEPLDEEQLEAMAKHETLEDKIFQKFKNQIAAEPEQVKI